MAENKPLIVIPARIGSTRLKNKPLREIGGVPLIVHVCRRALEADIGPVLLSTDDQRVLTCVRGLEMHGMLCQPPNEHCGSDRVTFSADGLGHDYIINLQGDLPFIDPQIIRDLWAKRQESKAEIVTARTEQTFVSIIDTDSDPDSFDRIDCDLHIGLYAYTREALADFAAYGPTDHELAARLEQRRANELGMTFDYIEVDHMPLEINTESDLKHANLIASMLRRAEDTGVGDGWPSSHPGPDDGGF